MAARYKFSKGDSRNESYDFMSDYYESLAPHENVLYNDPHRRLNKKRSESRSHSKNEKSSIHGNSTYLSNSSRSTNSSSLHGSNTSLSNLSRTTSFTSLNSDGVRKDKKKKTNNSEISISSKNYSNGPDGIASYRSYKNVSLPKKESRRSPSPASSRRYGSPPRRHKGRNKSPSPILYRSHGSYKGHHGRNRTPSPDSSRRNRRNQNKQNHHFALNIDDITFQFEQMNMTEESDCASNLSIKKYHTERSQVASQNHDKMSIHFIKVMIGKDNAYIIRQLKHNEEELKNFLRSPIKREHMDTVFNFISKISSIDYEHTKKTFLNNILSEFVQNLSNFIEHFIEFCRTDYEIVKNMKLITCFFEQISNYIPLQELNNYTLLISKTLEICNDTDMPKELIKDLENCKKNISSQIQLNEEEIITYKSLNIFPTREELFIDSLLSIQNIIKGSYDNIEQYIDIQFKLLKEDYLIGVRSGINQYLQDLEKNKKPINHDIFVYNNVVYSGFSADDHPMKKVLHRFTLDSKPLKNVNWETSKRLIHGSLLFFSNNNFESLFIGVLDDKLKEESSSYNTIDVALVGKTLKIPLNSKFVMVESRVFFEPFYQVCNTLKDIHPQLLPLAKYIVYADTNPELPKYLNTNSCFTINDIEAPLNNINLWPNPETIGLNCSQVAALHAALTREMVVIQGPPGTGKTYLGIKLINILLDNKDLWGDGKSPIFVACYRNGAVDQILDSLASGKAGKSRNVVRLGSRSNSEILKNCTLKNTVGHRRDPIMYDELNTLKLQLIEIKQNINELEKCKSFVREKQGLLKSEVFKAILTQEQNRFFSTSKDSFVSWLLEDDDEDFYTEENEEIIWTLINEGYYTEGPKKSKNKKKYLRSTHEFVCLSVYELARELADLDWEIQGLLEEENKMNMSHMQYIAEIHVKYYSKMDLLRKIINRIHMKHTEIDEPLINFVDLKALRMNERWSLYNYWAEQFFKLCEARIDQLVDSHDIKLVDFLYKRDLNDGENLRSANVDVVGATTTGAARLNKLLTALKPKIVIIEEAAEVLEAHTITSLTEHCQHLILIGDHKQLRPSPASHTSVTKYHMDVSLFERMILNGMECFSLTEQHRMRPEISCLIAPYFYRDLSNHPSVEEYPNVKGMKKNLFFLDHKISEDKLEESDSHRNKFEAELTLQVTSYIIQQGYEPCQVTILTLYVAQLLYLKSIKKRFPYLDDVEIQVVDNFQGEENDIIVLSLVRSNSTTIGFLSKENRVCVALSRAKQGFYMLGNMETLQLNSSVWKEMRKVLINNGSLDAYLPLRCETHKRITKINCIEDFYPLINGGCSEECGLTLECGHTCNQICHPTDLDHVKIYKCNKPCAKLRNCEKHNCTAECGQECPPCDVKIPETLDCGHSGFRICGGKILQCHTPCSVLLECGHSCPKTCHKEDDHSEIECKAICNKVNETCKFLHRCPKLCQEECGLCMVDSAVSLDCGHVMQGICSEISLKECTQLTEKFLLCGHVVMDECYMAITDITCQEKKKLILNCNHEAEVLCEVNKEDIECTEKVQKRLPCNHVVETLCSTLVEDVPCMEPIKRTLECGHVFENAPCSTPINELICEIEVTTIFECGHQMTLNCGDPNPKCMADVEVTDACGHTKKIACSSVTAFKSNNDGSMHCKAPCNLILPCKHKCTGTCGKCMQGRVHAKCIAPCGDLLICGHKCSVQCWNDFHSCKNRCINSCEHKNCTRDCGEICEKCTVPCKWACMHYKCKKKCWEACDRPKCLFPCTKILPCGHQCFGLCGETCPPICLICKPQDNMSMTDRFIFLEDCQHVVSERMLSVLLDKTVGILRCPECSVPIVRTMFVKQHTRQFFSKFTSVRSFAADLYNNKHAISLEFTRNFRTLSDVLKFKFEDCDSLNKLLQILLKRTLPIMKYRDRKESKLALKTLLFVCFYITDVLKMIKVEGISAENTTKFLNKVNYLAFYLVKKIEKKISPREMFEFSQELKRLKCMIDFMVLEQDVVLNGLSNFNIFSDVENKIFSLKEFTNEDMQFVVRSLATAKNVVLSNHQLLSAESRNTNKISEFFNKYYVLSYHSNQWLKCDKGHNYYSKEISHMLCPVCSNDKNNKLFYS